MARTPLLRLLQDAARREGACDSDLALSRRQVLIGAGALAGAALAHEALAPLPVPAATDARIYVLEVTEGLVPALQRRGLVRTEYQYPMLRDNLRAF